MANRHRGYITIELDGEEYALRYDFDALARLDQRLGQSFFKVLQEGNLGFHVIREALAAGLANPANGRGATKALRSLVPGEFDYYVEKVIEGLEAAGILKQADDEGEPTAPKRGKQTASTGTSTSD